MTLNHEEKRIDYRPVEAGLLYDDGFLRVHAIPTEHCPNSFAYLVQSMEQTVLFTSDLRRPEVDFPKVAMEMKLDLLVCEAAHFSATEYLPVLERCAASKVCVTLYSDLFLDSVLQIQRTLQERGTPVVLATDGLQLDV